MDGECVAKWCAGALERAQAHILQGLGRGLASLASAGGISNHVGRLGALVAVLEALEQPQPRDAPGDGGAGPPPAPPDGPLAAARRLHQCAQVPCQHPCSQPACAQGRSLMCWL